jgi:hypothetical protein
MLQLPLLAVLNVKIIDPGVPVVVVGPVEQTVLLLLQLRLNPQLLHLVHLRNALTQVLNKLRPVQHKA